MSRVVTYDMDGNEVEDDDLTFNGGTAEDWYNAYTELVQGRGIVDNALLRDFKRVDCELKQARTALAHQRRQRKRAESLLKDVPEDIGALMLEVETLKAENAELKKRLSAVQEALG